MKIAVVVRSVVSLAVVGLLSGTARAAEENGPGSNAVVQLGVGALFPGEVFIEDIAFDTGSGPVLSLAVDGVLAPKFSMGAFVLRAETELTEVDVDVAITTIGFNLKGRFGRPDGWQFRPGIVFGYQMIDADIPDGDDIIGFDIAPILELATPPAGNFGGALQVTAISQPVGGNDEVEVTFAPIVIVGVVGELRF